jgi:imidazolonepropionase-like amidohydrolase
LHDELRILIECGFNNLEALQTATLNPSIIGERMGLDYRWGRVVNGYKADLIFTDNNPLENLDALREPECVMKSGVLYLKNDLQALR